MVTKTLKMASNGITRSTTLQGEPQVFNPYIVGMPKLGTCTKVGVNSVRMLEDGTIGSFLMKDDIVFPNAMLWVTGSSVKVFKVLTEEPSQCFKVLEINGVLDCTTNTIRGNDGREHMVHFNDPDKWNKYEYHTAGTEMDISIHGDVSALITGSMVEVLGVAPYMRYTEGMDFTELSPVVIPESADWDGKRTSWHLKNEGALFEWMLASWKLTVSRSPHMVMMVPDCMLDRVCKVVAEVDSSGALD